MTAAETNGHSNGTSPALDMVVLGLNSGTSMVGFSDISPAL
jgi:hypothetical protein